MEHEEDTMVRHHDRYADARVRATHRLATIIGKDEVGDDWACVEWALGYALKHGTPHEASAAILSASEWAWGYCEEQEH